MSPGFSPADRLDALGALGLVLYLDDAGQLRARGARQILLAAQPALVMHRGGIVAELKRREAGRVRRAG